MKRLIDCAYNMDTGRVEARFADGMVIGIDCEAVEDMLDAGMLARSELDWLIYNKPLEYMQLVLSGEIGPYAKGTPEHRLED